MPRRKQYIGLRTEGLRGGAGNPSTTKLPVRTVFCRDTMPSISLTLRACAITSRCFRPIRRRKAKITRVATDMKPRPPIWIRHKITICPKSVHWVQVSKRDSPVTQVAEVAVNKAGRKPQDTPPREAAGRHSSPAPSKIMARNTTATTLVALMALGRFSTQNRYRIFRSGMARLLPQNILCHNTLLLYQAVSLLQPLILPKKRKKQGRSLAFAGNTFYINGANSRSRYCQIRKNPPLPVRYCSVTSRHAGNISRKSCSMV